MLLSPCSSEAHSRGRPRRRWSRHDFTVVFVNLPVPALTSSSRGSNSRELMSLAVLAAMCRQYGFSYTVLDAVLDPRLSSVDAVVREIARHQRVVLCLHVMGRQWVDGALALWDALAETETEILLTLAGGNYATIYRDDLARDMPWLDRVVIGEGEFRLLQELYRVVYGLPPGDLPKVSTFSIVDPTVTPTPEHYAIDLPDRNPLEVISARGCPGRCSFCEIACFYGRTRQRWRRRNTSSVRREILAIHEKTGQTWFPFVDDAFLALGEDDLPRRHLLKAFGFLSGLIPGFGFSIYAKPETVDPDYFRALQEVGLRRVYLGIESFHAGWLRMLRKANTPDHNVRAIETVLDLGLELQFGFIMISPLFTLGDIRRELAMLRRHLAHPGVAPRKLFQAPTNALLIYRRTKIYDDFKRRGWLREDVFDPEYEVHGYTIDPVVGTYLETARKLQLEVREAETLDDAVRWLDGMDELCAQLGSAAARTAVAS